MGDGHHLRRSDRDANLLFGHSGSYNNALHETATYPIDGHRSCIWFSARNPGPDGYATCPASSLSTDCPSYFLCMGSLWHDGNMLHESAVLEEACHCRCSAFGRDVLRGYSVVGTTNAMLASYVLLVVIGALFGVSNGATPQESATGNE